MTSKALMWDKIGRALAIQPVSEEAAMVLLRDGLKEGGYTLSGDVPQPQGPLKLKPPVAYGVKGYTDSEDPRAVNATYHSKDGEKVEAVHVSVWAFPARLYRCKHVRVIGETEARGRTVAWVRQPGAETVILATGYDGEPGQYQLRMLHEPGKELIVNRGFKRPALGTFAIFIERNGQIISDEVCSLGLPDGHHVCYEITFEER